MSRLDIYHQDDTVRMSFVGTPVLMRERRQMRLYPDLDDRAPATHKTSFVARSLSKELILKLENASSTAQPIALPVLKEIVDALEALHLLEAIYGYADGKSCAIVAIADDLPGTQRDKIWKVNLDFQRRHPDIDVDIRIMQRRGRDLADVFEDDSTAIIVREAATV